MSTATVEPERVRTLNDADVDADGRYVVYWMQAAQRAEQNPALEHAIQRANAHDVPIVVCAIVIPDYPDASHRQFAFMPTAPRVGRSWPVALRRRRWPVHRRQGGEAWRGVTGRDDGPAFTRWRSGRRLLPFARTPLHASSSARHDGRGHCLTGSSR
ncbi:hypothetical protein YM304_39800 [Ilumatobacter coccineus YM16-304]|uniref:Photolyase/cryptochrome alpha/beta domain-containing protein n=1 Tax=Ilumatobacter coccineus (strain NBRC 103263 / KCTC 29153 / YM16-304) TaxID=1313172 RepID=A0A6C7E9G4_ILUCY|nr:hypothetical protein YM304_39800 [Ilumatobacter coccineus YM16-304]